MKRRGFKIAITDRVLLRRHGAIFYFFVINTTILHEVHLLFLRCMSQHMVYLVLYIRLKTGTFSDLISKTSFFTRVLAPLKPMSFTIAYHRPNIQLHFSKNVKYIAVTLRALKLQVFKVRPGWDLNPGHPRESISLY